MSSVYQKHIRQKLGGVPKVPGVYLMKDASGNIIYVGKAKVLKSRLSSYFNASDKHQRTDALVREIADFDVMITATDVDAYLLERTLIKHHKPRFNVNLRDDKEYPYLRLNLQEEWPRFEKVRRRKDDGAFYMGPFSSAGQLKVMINMMYKIFPLIRCSRYEFANTKRPCNYYHMKLCLGPCTLPVDKQQYLEMVKHGIAFLQGRNRDLVRVLKQSMKDASAEEDYELAALYRDQLQAFERITERQSVIVEDVEDADVIGLFQADGQVSYSVQQVREGKLTGQDNFIVKAPIQDEGDAIVTFLLQYYDSRSLPLEILLPLQLEDDIDSLREALQRSDDSGRQVKIASVSRGPKRDLIHIATKNAKYQWDEAQRLEVKRRAELDVLQEKLQLQVLPRRMECIDISNIQGTAIVASNVCFIDGKPAKEQYRLYSVKTVEGAPDDFASMREVVERRLERGVRDGDLPDLLVIDGGRGQLSAALDSLAKFPGLQLAIISLAKSRVERKGRGFVSSSAPDRSFERVFFPDRELPQALAPGSPECRLLTQIRDEAHRFAISFHRKKRAKLSRKSFLDDVPGIGKVLRQRLLDTFKDMDGLRNASLAELQKVPGLSQKSAETLYGALQGSAPDQLPPS